MPSSNLITCHLVHGTDPGKPFPELLPTTSTDGSTTCYVPVDLNPNPSQDYSALDIPYSVHWSIDPTLLNSGGIQVQVQVDGCQKGQPRCYEGVGPDRLAPPSSVFGMDDGLWVVLHDGTRRRPWVMGEIKTTHPHSALADKYILDRVGSVSVTFSRANVVPTSRVVPLVPVFSGSAPLPDRMREKLSHWTKLGYIENHPPAAELGLVAEEIGDVIAQFTFYYRSREILQRLLPALFFSDIRISFPTASDVSDRRSIHSVENANDSRSEGCNAPSESHRASMIRRAFGSAASPRLSMDGALLLRDHKIAEKEEVGKLKKFNPKRVRAVSMRIAKRYSLGHKQEGESSSRHLSPEAQVEPNKVEDLSTIEGLKNEVIQLRLELNQLKKHLQL